MEKRSVKSKEFTWVTYRCEACHSQFEGIVRKETGGVRLTCSVCGKGIVVSFNSASPDE